MTKRMLLTLGLLLVIGAALYAGGAQESAAATDATGGDKIAMYRPDPDERYSLTLTVQGGPAVPLAEDAPMVAYWEDQFNVDINMIDITGLGGDAGTQKLNLLISSGDTPDMFQANAETLQKYYESEVVAPLDDDVMLAYMPTVMKKLVDESDGTALDYGKFDDVRYGLIRGFWWPAQVRDDFIVRGDWLDAVGLEPPTTLEDYEEMFYAFANEDPDGNGADDTYGLSETMANTIYGAFGLVLGHWSLVDGELASDDIQPGIKDALAYLNKWYEDGVLDPEFVTGENQGGYWAITHAFMNGRIGATSMGNVYHWTPDLPGRSAGANYQEADKVGIYDNLLFLGPPIGPDGGQAANSQGELISNSFLVMGAHMTDEPQKMGKLFEMNEYMFRGDKDTFLTVFMGIQGEHWRYDDNGFPKFIGEMNAREAQKLGAWGAFLWFQFLEESMYTDGSVIEWAIARNYQEGLKRTMVPAFINTTARSQYQAELNKIRDETFTAIITGDQPLSAFDDYVEKWLSSGGQQLTDELNDWYDTIQ